MLKCSDHPVWVYEFISVRSEYVKNDGSGSGCGIYPEHEFLQFACSWNLPYPKLLCTMVKMADQPMLSRTKDVLNDFFISHQDLSEYVGLSNIERGFHGEPALKKCYIVECTLLTIHILDVRGME